MRFFEFFYAIIYKDRLPRYTDTQCWQFGHKTFWCMDVRRRLAENTDKKFSFSFFRQIFVWPCTFGPHLMSVWHLINHNSVTNFRTVTKSLIKSLELLNCFDL